MNKQVISVPSRTCRPSDVAKPEQQKDQDRSEPLPLADAGDLEADWTEDAVSSQSQRMNGDVWKALPFLLAGFSRA